MTANQSDDYTPVNSYQDDIDTRGTDMITNEETDDPSKGFGVPADKFKEELDRMEGDAPAGENPEYDTDDMREHIEDLDEDDKR
ncbi:hypothetical protein FJZ39_04515 [Candidatus Saccharibacteria bacterium]|nr:hypothetical protein [Candidatus Saccharibacteria bacterium]